MLPAVGVVFALLLGGLLYQSLGRWRDSRRYPPPGRLVRSRGPRLHLLEQGSGEPAVFLEAGVAGSLLGWARVQPEIAQFTRVCSYDRAGLGWSDPAAAPRTLDNLIAEFSDLRQLAGDSRPIVLAGHSFGALLVRAYACRYPESVAGLVLIDPAGVQTWSEAGTADRRRLAMGARLSRRGALLARLGIVRFTLDLLASGSRWLPEVVGKTAAGRGSSTITRLIGEVQLLPAECAPRIRSHWSNPRGFRAMAEYLECLPQVAAALKDMRVPSNIPVTILSAGTATGPELAERERWAAESERGRHIIIPDSGHWIQIRRPEAVVEAVREMVAELRAASG